MPDLLDLRPESSNGLRTAEQEHYEMDNSLADEIPRSGSRQNLLGHSLTAMPSGGEQVGGGLVKGMARHTLGLILLLCVVFLWTLSNFLGSSLFADGTYDKPAFLTWLNSSSFMLAMVPTLVKSAYRLRRDGLWEDQMQWVKDRYRRGGLRLILQEEDDDPALLADSEEQESFLKPNDDDDTSQIPSQPSTRRKRTHLAVLPTARLAFFFCFLWFLANYFAMACLKYTTVASATILTSTSSIFTLIIGALTRTEKFTFRKLGGVCASLAGIILISKVDLANPTPPDQQRRAPSSFPDKSPTELLLGDALALFSALIYGIYTITLKRTTLLHHPLQLNLPLFFGLVGTFNFILLLPIFPILHYTHIEPFALPPTRRIWTILLINSGASLASDICWAYAMILTSPLVVTVGLSLTIPLSLVGEMIIQGRFESWVYWVGAGVVVGSFIFVDREEKGDEREVLEQNLDARHRRGMSVSGELGGGGSSGSGVASEERGGQEALDYR